MSGNLCLVFLCQSGTYIFLLRKCCTKIVLNARHDIKGHIYEWICLPSGGAVAQSVESATPGEEVLVQFPLWPPAPYWLGRCQYSVIGWDKIHGLPALSRVGQHVKLSDVLSWGMSAI